MRQGVTPMKDVLFVVGFLVFWIGLNRWVLPWFGVQTCMSGACTRVPSAQQSEPLNSADKVGHDHTPSPNEDDNTPLRDLPVK